MPEPHMHAAALLSVTTGALMSISGPDMPLSWTDWSWDWRYRLLQALQALPLVLELGLAKYYM
jgi:hypothetical protein